MSAFITHIVDRFTMLFGGPQTTDLAKFVADYERELAGIDQGILREASDILVRNHSYQTWPTIAECLSAVREATRWRERENEIRAAAKPEPERKPPPKASIARVDAWVAGFKAHVAEQKAGDGRPDGVPSLNRDQWAHRQLALTAAGKACLTSIVGRAP